ncbi:TolC family protein [Pedobacter sp. HMF7647]|uniref:TolC family protein n=1 Tax=Hufsiella arboris TaxID=2695275 RepID=A0A7K1Y9V9_9SPHI|nr:TolC family protein [Hufsiella arboris]MXV51200.1 TolC family protein [Hufsiella arboris]
MKQLYTLIFVFAGFTAVAQQDTSQIHNFNLQQCIDYAYEHQVSVKNAQLDIKKAEYKVKETIGIGLPQIDGTANFQDYLKLPTTLLPGEFVGQPGTFIPVKFGVKYQSTVAFQATQLLFNGTYLVGLKASKTYKELSQRSFTRTQIETNASVTKAYYQVLVNDEQLRLVDANIKEIAQQRNEVTQLNKQGFSEKIDVDRINVQYNNLVTARENTVRSLALAVQLLKFQMGMPVSENLIIKEKIANLNISEAANSNTAMDSTAYHNRIEYGLLETQKKLNELDLKRYKSQYLPTLSAFSNGSYSFQNNFFNNLYGNSFPSLIVGLQLNVPIFSGLQRLNQVRQANVEVLKSINTLNDTKNSINLQVQQARTNFSNSLASYNNQKQNMDLANEVLRVSKIKYQQGVGSSIEVTQAQTQLETAELNYIEALYNALVSRVDLNQALGNIK